MQDIYIERKNYSDIIEKRIRALKDGYRQNLAIVGDEYSGKTTLVSHFINNFHDNRILLIYVQNRAETLDSFAKRFIGVLLYNFLNNADITLKEDLFFLIEKSSKFIPKTIEKIKFILSCLEKNKNKAIFTELLSIPEIIHLETKKSCVVILDEFQNLETLGIKNLYKEWANQLILQKNTMHIIISSLKYKTNIILSKHLSLLFGNFEILEIEPLDIRKSEYYIEQRLGKLNISQGLKNFLVNFTGGSPFYLKLISDSILKSGQNNIPQIIEELLFNTTGIMHQRFINYIKPFIGNTHSQDYILILQHISNGNNKIKSISHLLHKTNKELDSRITQLLSLEILSRSADFLKINDRVFNFWLRFVYNEKLNCLTTDEKSQRTQFREKIEKLIQEFVTNAQKPVMEKMQELLHLFEDDTIQIERKKLRLNHFREIKPLEFHKGSIKQGLIGRSSEALWILAFKKEMLTEEDITEFAQECKKYRHKTQKKIIITFKDMEANAKLRAMEEKIMTWDLNNLNLILDLFSKPQLISCE